MKFRTTVLLSGKTATGIVVPAEAVAELGTSKKPAVKVTIGEYSYSSTVATMGGQFMIPLSSEHRKGAGVSAGEGIEVELALDTQPREVEVPADLAALLEQHAEAKRFWDGLSYSNKRRFVLSIEDAKTAETRQRRLDKTIGLLNEGKAQ
ncbi:YdeI/OmpD-associated family protein [Paenibacillus sp. MMS20-IR301]|uniref:YdeI/OmpD-associated family protein n=1 Tax=Paenibacillus sp. MMS20-IR301 TaxID=2895946 RepID=UPI0028EFBF3F|nr:YdeI/OmpD-associated family protein [Paenibacillus sp. MMS20-IR301]WNS42408.1 YdeI/OmpD-associated family protein [Paenibacillus sp. MMS20-IR301]